MSPSSDLPTQAELDHACDIVVRQLRAGATGHLVLDRLMQAQKLEAVGQLAGGIAHDFNNLLAVILNYSEFVSEGLKDSGKLEDLEEIRAAATRGSSLVKQLLAFCRREDLSPSVIDVNSVVMDIQKMLKRLIGEDIALSVVVDPKPTLVQLDPSQLEQVLTNLAVNARDAMPLGGSLVIEATNVELNDNEAERVGLMRGRYVRVVVSDTGVGVIPEALGHLFEPFFTTKERGRGTGLGLATTYGIVTQAGGHIGVDSEPGAGTTFRILLPAIEAQTACETGTEAVAPTHGGGLVLVVEDERAVAAGIERILATAGYSVLRANSAEHALDVYERAKGSGLEIDLVISDIVLGGLSGRALADVLAATGENVPMLFMSGYTNEVIARYGALVDHIRLLGKPFTSEQLLNAVASVLAEAPR